jgi:transcription elongation factor Elf1
MNKRIKKKLEKKTKDLECPLCSKNDGIIALFKKGKIEKYVFLYCDSCGYEIKIKD